MNQPIICFGQQPCGFFPKRFLVAKIETARKLQKEIGGKVVFFYHDSDADYRETITVFCDRATQAEVRLNFTQENKLQKKFSPLYLKRIPTGWKEEILKQLPRFIDNKKTAPFGAAFGSLPMLKSPNLTLKNIIAENYSLSSGGPEGNRTPETQVSSSGSAPAQAHQILLYHNPIEIFASVSQKTAADFCLEMYQKMELLNGIEVIRSSDKNFRQQASELDKDYFADVEYMGEVVRAQMLDGKLQLHEGGGKYIVLPEQKIEKWQKNPARDSRFAWMQSVIRPTHYIYGEGEKEYLKTTDFPEVKFVDREKIDDPDFAWLPNS